MIDLALKVKHKERQLFPATGEHVYTTAINPHTQEKALKDAVGMNLKRYILACCNLWGLRHSRAQDGMLLLKDKERILVGYQVTRNMLQLEDTFNKAGSPVTIDSLEMITDTVKIVISDGSQKDWQFVSNEFVGLASSLLMGFSEYIQTSPKAMPEYVFVPAPEKSIMNVPPAKLLKWGQYVNNKLREQQESNSAVIKTTSAFSMASVSDTDSSGSTVSDNQGQPTSASSVFSVKPKFTNSPFS